MPYFLDSKNSINRPRSNQYMFFDQGLQLGCGDRPLFCRLSTDDSIKLSMFDCQGFFNFLQEK
jgi:hypothetical protein